jgi:23S rRNA pseudouridine1911/1915/1917 synthase
MIAEFQAPATAPLQEVLFARLTDVKRLKIKQWLRHGAVSVNGRQITRHDAPVQAGDTVRVDPLAKPEPAAASLPRGMKILHEDAAVVVIEKPAGMLSIAQREGQTGSAYERLTDYIRKKNRGRNARVWIVHRLDRDTSGVMLFALSREAKLALQNGWRQVEKKYLAVVEGVPTQPAGTLRHWLDESDPARVKVLRQTPDEEDEAREAVTHYQVIRGGPVRSLLELRLVTGRRHQIRVQCAAAGWPVAGDPKYDPAHAARGVPRLALHACSLKFRHPLSGQEVLVESPAPMSISSLLPEAAATGSKRG